jgi:hypothetical protein
VTNAEIRSLLLELIGDIAPEADPASVTDHEDIREASSTKRRLSRRVFTYLMIASEGVIVLTRAVELCAPLR